jgi:hypothetical protein
MAEVTGQPPSGESAMVEDRSFSTSLAAELAKQGDRPSDETEDSLPFASARLVAQALRVRATESRNGVG